jgi:hypothetical protein
MNESFYDLRELDDSFGDIDIMPYFDSLKNESESGFIVVPILGGGTCNTEFEVLTGFSDYFYQAERFRISSMCIRTRSRWLRFSRRRLFCGGNSSEQSDILEPR